MEEVKESKELKSEKKINLAVKIMDWILLIILIIAIIVLIVKAKGLIGGVEHIEVCYGAIINNTNITGGLGWA